MKVQDEKIMSESTTSALIHPNTRIGHVHLTVADLDREIAFYQNVLGMQLHWREGASAGLGAGEGDLLRLTEVPGARPSPDTTGLYHFALLYPNRKELARAIARQMALRYPNSPTDHVMSETSYLDDPQGQTIELYIRTLHRGEVGVINDNLFVRRYDGKPASGRDPLDLDDLFQELTPADALDVPLPKGTIQGHVHLYASSLSDSMHFYHEVLGFAKGPSSNKFRMGEVGLTQDQNHVIAFNTWKGNGTRPAPVDALGIRYFTLVLPDQAELGWVLQRVQQHGIATEQTEEGVLVRDPSSIAVVLTTPR